MSKFLILERVGPSIMGDPFRVDPGDRVCVWVSDLVAGAEVEVGVVQESGEVIASFATVLPSAAFRKASDWRPCRRDA